MGKVQEMSSFVAVVDAGSFVAAAARAGAVRHGQVPGLQRVRSMEVAAPFDIL
jgi:DNA-binding transcriptional LysR family regulator